jgi:DNA replication factor GINS
MQLDELQSVRDRERQTDKLQQLRASFYEDAGEFIQQLHAERDRAAERADDPFDAPEVNRLTDEINTAEQTVEAIYEKRVGKIVKAASFAAADLPAEADGMTAEEQDLFDQLVDDIKDNREHVLDVLAGEESPVASEQSPDISKTTSPPDQSTATEPTRNPTEASPGGTPSEPSARTADVEEEPAPKARTESGSSAQPNSDERVSAAEVMGGGPNREEQSPRQTPPETGQQTQPEQPVRKDGGMTRETGEDGSTSPASTVADAPTSGGVSRETVRITDDVGTFVGSDDRDYDLEPNDIVTLPATNADVLVERGSAEQLE